MDMINDLPDDILHKIISLFSAKEAVIASIVSKKWWNMITIIRDVEFYDTTVNEKSLMDFLDEVLALPLSVRVRTFTLKSIVVNRTQFARVNNCICNVVKRGVIELTIGIRVENGYYPFPFEVFTCKTVVKLDLGGDFKIEQFPNNAFLPKLKTIVFENFNGGTLDDKICSACPMLIHIRQQALEATVVAHYWKIEICGKFLWESGLFGEYPL